MTRKLLLVVNDAAFFLSHRLDIAKEAKKKGFNITIGSPYSSKIEEIKSHGFNWISVPFKRSGVNPIKEILSFFCLALVLIKVKPDIAHFVTIKPVLYGGLLSRILRIPSVVFAISGMGHLFTVENSKFLNFLTNLVYPISLNHRNSAVIVQNKDDYSYINSMSLRCSNNIKLVKGSGVDLKRYSAAQVPDGDPIVMLHGRMLWTKGVGEFIEAARILDRKTPSLRMVLVGSSDDDNPAAISREELLSFQEDIQNLEWWDYCSDMEKILPLSSLIVLPSYREGFSKSLLEAAAIGRAIITTNTPGCREGIVPGVTGELIPIKNSKAIVKSIEELLFDRNKLIEMGKNARKKAEEEFDINKIVEVHADLYKDLLK